VYNKAAKDLTLEMEKVMQTCRKHRGKKCTSWAVAQPLYNQVLALNRGRESGVCKALGLTPGNFRRYQNNKSIPLFALMGLKGVLYDTHENGGLPQASLNLAPMKPALARDEVIKLIALCADAKETDLLVKLACLL